MYDSEGGNEGNTWFNSCTGNTYMPIMAHKILVIFFGDQCSWQHLSLTEKLYSRLETICA